jgi:hypothetical protein
MLQLVPGISDKSLRQLHALEAPLNPDCETLGITAPLLARAGDMIG